MCCATHTQGHKINTMYLDTTYAHEKHTIPDQKGPVELVGDFVAEAMASDRRLGMRPG